MSDSAGGPSTEDPFEREVPFLDHLGIRPVSAEAGRAEFELAVERRHLRTLGLLHGGVVLTLLDTAMGFAAVTVAPDGHYVVTVQLNANFVRPAREGDRLVAIGQTLHTGRQTVVSRGELRTSDGALVASGTATFMFVAKG